MSFAKISGTAAATLLFALSSAPAFAAGGHNDTKSNGLHGEPGVASGVTTTINVEMFDNYYEPESIDVKEGETVRFVITNKGDAVHEFAIATAEMHISHQPEMEMMVEHGVIDFDRVDWTAAAAMQKSMGHGMHSEANSILLEPGKSGEIIWTFPKHVDLEFACNIPGHYGSGMVGEFRLDH